MGRSLELEGRAVTVSVEDSTLEGVFTTASNACGEWKRMLWLQGWDVGSQWQGEWKDI